MSRIVIVEQTALGIGGHYFAYTGAIARAAVEEGFETVVLHNVKLDPVWDIPGIRTVPVFTYTWSEAERAGIRDWAPGNIAFEYAEALETVAVGRDDHVLFHTLGKVDLENVLRYLLGLAASSDLPSFHIILRYDISELEPLMDLFGPLFRRLRDSSIGQRVFLHTDTDLLTRDYTALTGVAFGTLPIPFEQQPLKDGLVRERKAEASPLEIVYLGDARLEKNFHYIPQACRELWDSHLSTGVAKLVAQCNFNTPGGETGQLAAVQSLAQFPPSTVHLIDRPQPTDEYYAALARAALVIVPYCPERYRSRSSGILVEAIAAGKPVVTTKGSWMETMVDESHAVLLDTPDDLGAAIGRILDDYSVYRAAAKQKAAAMMEWSSGKNFVRSMIATTHRGSSAPDKRGHVMLIMNGDAMELRNGSSIVARAQVDYLARTNRRITALFLTRRSGTPYDMANHIASINESISDLPIDDAFVSTHAPLSLNPTVSRKTGTPDRHTIAADLAISREYVFGGDLLAQLRNDPPDAILLNYITNYGVVEALGLTGVPLICEMHDVQSFQKAIYGERTVSEQDLDLEFDLLSRCDYLISLNAVETRYTNERLPDRPCITTGVQCPPKPIDFGILAGCETLSQVIAMSNLSSSGLLNAQNMPDWFKDWTSWLNRVDLLYVSSNHKANASGLRWFLDEVFIPRLSPLGINLFVAGSVDQLGPWPEDPHLVFLGRVDDLDALYAAAKVVVLPITEGAGSPVKTYEALAYRRPIVATPLALRGFSGAVPGVDTPQPADFADRLIALVGDSDLRAAQRRQVAASLQAMTDANRFDEAMDAAFAHVLGHVSQGSTGRVAPLATVSDVEWGEPAQNASILLRSLLLCGDSGAADLAILAAMDADILRSMLQEMVAALLVRKDAPVLSVDRDLNGAIRRRMPLSEEQAASFVDMVLTIIKQRVNGASSLGIRHRGRPARLHVLCQSAGSSAITGGWQSVAEFRRGVAAWHMPAAPDHGDDDLLALASVALPLGADAVAVITESRDCTPHAQTGVRISDLGLAETDLLVIEVFQPALLAAGHVLAVKLDGSWLPLTRCLRGGHTTYRAKLRHRDLRGVGLHTLSVHVISDRGEGPLAGGYAIQIHRIIGFADPVVLDLLDASDLANRDVDAKLPMLSARVDAMTQALRTGLAFSPEDSRALRSLAEQPRDKSANLLRAVFELAEQRDALFASPLLRRTIIDRDGTTRRIAKVDLAGDGAARWFVPLAPSAARVEFGIEGPDFGSWPAALVVCETSRPSPAEQGLELVLPMRLNRRGQVRLVIVGKRDEAAAGIVQAYRNGTPLPCVIGAPTQTGEVEIIIDLPGDDDAGLGERITVLSRGAAGRSPVPLADGQLKRIGVVLECD